MAKICQLHADLHYFLCMELVDMRKQFRGLQGLISEYYNFKKNSYLCRELRDKTWYLKQDRLRLACKAKCGP